MFSCFNQPGFSIWLKPIFKSQNRVIDCKTSFKIDYQEIKHGDIVELEFRDSKNSSHKQIYISTSNWSREKGIGSFITLTGKHILLSSKVFRQLNVCKVGAFQA